MAYHYTAPSQVQHWLNQLCEELSERDQNKQMLAFTFFSPIKYLQITNKILSSSRGVLQSGDSDSHKKFASKSCPLRYGTAKIQEDAFNLFQVELREYLGSYGTKIHGSHHNRWGVTALSVSASKIVVAPSKNANLINDIDTG
ncbi:hypothetical protein JCGZ_01925 [Jatropha curcas]|uniref:DNA polymerase Y-family little finger domain-containing protein n=1 Tax=Jatropha curcas TaxID=180498 RepID=A0A067JFP5_JATCU|nr:hypothetical protein JCGZ_01925 [Jatropha curcas]